MARIIEGVKEVKTLLYAHDAAVDAGDVIVVNGVVLIAVNDADADEENVWAFEGRAAFPKATGGGSAIDAPAKVYWDSGSSVITTTSAGNAGCGVCIEDAADADEEVVVDMDLAAPSFPSAADVSIDDAGGYTDQDDVEAALQEMFAFIPTVLEDPGDGEAIPVTRSGVCALTTGGSGETRTLADPDQAGLFLTLTLDVDGGGDAVVTVATAFNDTGNDTITFADAGETLSLVATQIDGNPVWRLVENDGAALSTA